MTIINFNKYEGLTTARNGPDSEHPEYLQLMGFRNVHVDHHAHPFESFGEIFLVERRQKFGLSTRWPFVSNLPIVNTLTSGRIEKLVYERPGATTPTKGAVDPLEAMEKIATFTPIEFLDMQREFHPQLKMHYSLSKDYLGALAEQTERLRYPITREELEACFVKPVLNLIKLIEHSKDAVKKHLSVGDYLTQHYFPVI